MDIFNLYAKLSLDTSDYERALGKAKADTKATANEVGADYKEIADESKKTGDKIEQNFSKSNDKVQVSFKGMAAVGISAVMNIAEKAIGYLQKLWNKAKEFIDYADKYSDLSAQYDIGTQQLQELNYIAEQSSTSLDELLGAMTQLYNRAQNGDEVFNKLGVSVKNADGTMKDMNEVFWATKSALDNIENSGDKSALMLEAFGRNAMSIGEVLRKDTSELANMADKANQLGLVMNQSTIDASSRFNDTLAELKQQGMAAFASLLMGAENGGEMVDEFFDRVISMITDNLPRILQTAVNMLGKVIARLAAVLPTLMPTLFEAINKIDWWKVGMDIIKGIGQGIINGWASMLEAIVNPFIRALNWIPGVNIPELKLGRVDFLGGSSAAATTINNSSATSKTIADNSTNTYNITVENTGNVEYDARALADNVIKEIAVRKSALGR